MPGNSAMQNCYKGNQIALIVQSFLGVQSDLSQQLKVQGLEGLFCLRTSDVGDLG